MIHINNKENCCGCNACVQVCPNNCIFIKEDNEGFLYPYVDESNCVGCHLCEKVCPIINIESSTFPLKVYAVKNKDNVVRMNSSSGGVFSLLAEKVIQNKGVIFGARFNEKWEVIHDYTETQEGLIAFRGSKYVQSNIGECFIKAKSFLRDGRYVLFSGTPCQIAGLKKFLRKDYSNLLTVECLCHGVPSPMVWRRYIEERSKQRKITSIIFRDKRNSWERYNFTMQFDNGIEETERAIKNIFMKGFLADLYLRPSCHKCPVKRGKSQSDLTIADFWGINNVFPEMNDDKGISLVLINSNKGKNIFLSLDLFSKETDVISAQQMNAGFTESIPYHKNRKMFFENIHTCTSLQSLILECTKKTLQQRFLNIVHRIEKKILKR